ncbi:efflux RND transporter periplasmic adaptor subunit [Pseudomonas sp. Irchel 3E13]|uniref:efflux RND transporter periplasmic adaptor subunit n=1 Tax=Pseudomonas sp. Irchel 3E13 TaxID=2008975 RepID=UPI000BA47640|nr:efflux RND transporter periplasmic adaptor subunit [Pseudomonas sp. Irchel 3E13]
MLLRRFVLPAVICVTPFALVACGEPTPADPRTAAPLVRVVTVQPGLVVGRAFTGTVAARVESDLGFRVAGKVLERLVDTGQTVKRGQPLMRLDPVDLKLAANAQRQAVAAVRARALQTADDEARYRRLRGTGAVSASTYDQYKADADSAKAQLSAAQAQAEVAINATTYAELLADADGVVMDTLVEPGQVVNAGQVVVRVAHAGPREAVIQLPENLRPALGSAAQATLFGTQGAGAATQLRQLSDVADRQTRTFEARYVLEGELAKAPLGSTITLRIADPLSRVPEGSQYVPIGALYDAGNGPGVWVVSGEPARVRWQAVVVQHLDESGASVSGPLKAGEVVVALGAHLLREGQEVRVPAQRDVAAVAGARP